MIAIKWIVLNIVLLMAAQCYSQTIEKPKSISLNFKEQPLSSVIEEIRSKAGVNFVYNDKLVSNVKVTVKLESESIEYTIKKILDGSGISYKEFPSNSYVLYKDKKPVEKHFRAVILNKNVVELDTAQILIEPKLISKINLTYPTDAVKHNLEGKVLIKILVNREGDVSKTNIEQTSGSTILDSAAIDYTHSLKFIPAKADGKPINIWISMLFKYFLDNK